MVIMRCGIDPSIFSVFHNLPSKRNPWKRNKNGNESNCEIDLNGHTFLSTITQFRSRSDLAPFIIRIRAVFVHVRLKRSIALISSQQMFMFECVLCGERVFGNVIFIGCSLWNETAHQNCFFLCLQIKPKRCHSAMKDGKSENTRAFIRENILSTGPKKCIHARVNEWTNHNTKIKLDGGQKVAIWNNKEF